jgi:hypothetical protein
MEVAISELQPAGARWMLAKPDDVERARFDDATMQRILELAGQADGVPPPPATSLASTLQRIVARAGEVKNA